MLNAINLFKNTTAYLIFAIVIGSLLGWQVPATRELANSAIDPIILALVFLLLFELPAKGIFKGLGNVRFLSIAWLVNFVAIPALGFVMASTFLAGDALFYTGLVIYFMAPCTDWYLGFTRLAKGNVELGAALLPINMISQLVLFPVYLLLFETVVEYKVDLTMLLQWFIQPLLAALFLRVVFKTLSDKLMPVCKILIPVTLTLLVALIFAANIHVLREHLSVVPLLLLTVFVFFLATFFLGELVAKLARLNYGEHCALTFTTSARNAPLMLGLATVALPNQPLIYATITIGMLIEFPHLMTLKSLMLRRLQSDSASELSLH